MRLLSAAGHAPGFDGVSPGLPEHAFGPGFHGPEAGWHWTDGAACLLLDAAPELRTLSFEVVSLAPATTQAA
jgi:hypothetical protein